MAKQPTHSDLMKKIGELEKRIQSLEPDQKLEQYRKALEDALKAVPQKEYVPYPIYPYPTWPQYPWYIYSSNAGTTLADATRMGWQTVYAPDDTFGGKKVDEYS